MKYHNKKDLRRINDLLRGFTWSRNGCTFDCVWNEFLLRIVNVTQVLSTYAATERKIFS